jgi:hypothetical protein
VNVANGANGEYLNNVIQRTSNYQQVSKRNQQLILILSCEVLLYIFTNLLYSINIAYSAITSGNSKSIERIRIESFIAYFSTPFLIIINNCAPFYLYLIVSSKFREDFKKLFTSCDGCHQIAVERINPPTNINRSAVAVFKVTKNAAS